MNLEQVALTGLAGLAVSVVGNYLVAMRRGAEALDAARGADLLDLRKQVEQLTPPKRTTAEEQKYAEAKAALDRLGQPALIILRHLEKHGTLIFRGSGPPPLPDGMKTLDACTCLDNCVNESLATKDSTLQSTGGLYPSCEDTYRIAPGMKAALDELLYRPQEQ